MNLYVSNLAYSVTDDELRSEFAAYGTVASCRVVMDRETGRSRGFGFVDMPNDTEAQAALKSLEGTNLAGRAIKIVEARPKEERPRSPQSGGGSGHFDPKKKQDRGQGGGFRESSQPSYNDWDDRDRGGKKFKPRDRGGRKNQGFENDWD